MRTAVREKTAGTSAAAAGAVAAVAAVAAVDVADEAAVAAALDTPSIPPESEPLRRFVAVWLTPRITCGRNTLHVRVSVVATQRRARAQETVIFASDSARAAAHARTSSGDATAAPVRVVPARALASRRRASATRTCASDARRRRRYVLTITAMVGRLVNSAFPFPLSRRFP